MKSYTLAMLMLLPTIQSGKATVTNVAWYRLGENDPGAASGLAVTNTTTDLIGVNHLKRYGSPAYTNAVSVQASNAVKSLLSVSLSGAGQYLSNAVVSAATNNFGVEVWVRPNTTNAGNYWIAANGFGNTNWAIYQSGNGYYGFIGGAVLGDFDNGRAAPGTWSHVAFVRINGTNTLYVNGILTGLNFVAPSPPTGGFAIGALPQFPTGSFFNGAIDELRVFTFAPGKFSTNDLLINGVATLAATGVDTTIATLNGTANTFGFPTTAWFEWGTTTNYNVATPLQVVASDMGNTNFSQTLNGISAGVKYHFRAAASNILGVTFGTNQSFTLPLFTLVVSNLPGVQYSAVAWGDYDNDGRLDILLTGTTNTDSSGSIAQVWRNTGTGFTNINAGLPGVFRSSAKWSDFNNDGRLDILLTGGTNSPSPSGDPTGSVAQVWLNTGAGFTNLDVGLPGINWGEAAAGDYDNDGRADILLAGSTNYAPLSSRTAQLWRNTGGGFVKAEPEFTAVGYASVAWGDYDNDGRLDVLLGGGTGSSYLSEVWRNTGSGFTNVNAGLQGSVFGSVAWGDFDNDGRLDILVAGLRTGAFPNAQVWRNSGAAFTNIQAGLQPVHGSASWGDYDNDGWLDILLIGTTNGYPTGAVTQVWRNTGNGFSNIQAVLPPVMNGAAAWGDYDNDGRLDILITGTNQTGLIAQVWRNNTLNSNQPPAAPTGLGVTQNGTTLTFSWNAAADAETPASGLTYNLRIGSTPGGGEIVVPMAASGGKRRLPQLGNRQQTRFWSTTVLPFNQSIYWSVQAVDSAFAGSPFAAEASFRQNIVLSPPAGIVPGDANGDGVVDQSELDAVLGNYWPYSPWLYMTNVAGLGGTNVTFTSENSTAGAFSVEFTTNLTSWQYLGPAIPRYLFTDTNAPALPQRYYRLRWP